VPETGKKLLPPKNKKPKKNKSRNQSRDGKNSNSAKNKKGFWGEFNIFKFNYLYTALKLPSSPPNSYIFTTKNTSIGNRFNFS
jgi:hypothetical protein